jgi:hypothetical protein
LLAEYRGVRNPQDLPPLTIEQILEWLDAFFSRTGRWPTDDDGPIPEAPDESWRCIDSALRIGYRGLPGGLSLPRLLAANRGVRNISALPRLTIKLILAWADAYYRRHGAWPGQDSGPVAEAPAESWGALNAALREGYRGLPGGSSLARLLRDKRQVRHIHNLPRLSIGAILKWCDAWHRRTGKWPSRKDGLIPGADGETWASVYQALWLGTRGLPGNSSLPRLLDEKRGVGSRTGPLTPALILSWADAHRARTGRWPNVNSGRIPETRDDTWKRIDNALRQGSRGLPKKPRLSLARLLNKFRGVRNSEYPPPVTESQIVRWARAHQRKTGKRPSSGSGPVLGVPSETWNALDLALNKGRRGLPGGSSLARLLEEHGIPRAGR